MTLGPLMLHLKQGARFPPLTKDVLRMYNMRFCPFAQRTRLVLAHKQIPHEVVNVNLKMKPDWFLERHPFGLVPVLEKNDDVVFESSVCNDYPDDVYPEKPLYPKDPMEKTRQKMAMAMFEKLVGRFNAVKSRDPEVKQKALTKLSKEMGVLEVLLTDTYFGGTSPMMVDYHIWPWYERIPALEEITGLQFLPADKFPKLTRWMEAMLKNPAVQESWLPKDLHVEFFLSFATGTPYYDAGLPMASNL